MSAFQQFCGGPLWNLSSVWQTEDPELTSCFQSTVLSWAPAGVLLLLTPAEVSSWQANNNPPIPFTILNLAKLLTTLGLLVLSALRLVQLERFTEDPAEAEYAGLGVTLTSYLYSITLLSISLRCGCVTSGPQFIFWFLDLLCRAVHMRTVARDYSQQTDLKQFYLHLIHLVLTSVMFLLNCLADQTTDQLYLSSRKPCPNSNCSFPNKMLYLWCTPLLWTGYRRPLTLTQLWDVSPRVASRVVVPQFARIYEFSVKKFLAKNSWFTYNSSHGKEKRRKRSERPQVSIFPSLVRCYGGTFLFGSALKVCCDLLSLASPKVMKLMIGFVESYSDPEIPSQEEWKGYFYLALLFCTVSLQSILSSQYWERMMVIGVKVRTALVAALYKKSLRISSTAKKESTVGEIVNLMSVDVQKFMDLLPFVNILWSSVLQISLSTYFIYQELGWPAFIGVSILIISMPLNGYIASLMKKFQLKQMKLKDKRIKLMNEILGGVKVLKLYAWEPSFISQVTAIRNQEIQVMKKAAYFNAFMSFFWTTAPFMVGLGAFTAYIFAEGGQVLTAEKAFVTLSYLNLMRIPLAVLPMMIAFLVQARVSLDRVNKFMNNEELSEDAVITDCSDMKDDAVRIRDGTFSWGQGEPRVLSDINLRIPAGSLTAVVGSVGSGKSSLVSAMLGETYKEAGRVERRGKVAYVAQQAWIQNSTLRDNITFCREYEEKKYETVIENCALRTDLEILPGGDQTEIGEKGINLSGGQKQRVSLARAVYSESDLYLLDDPLSAVDSHVGKHIFENVIGPQGALKDKTRVLVTHGITYLPKTDHIIVLKEGRISEQGSYEELIQQKGEFAQFISEYKREDVEDVAETGEADSEDGVKGRGDAGERLAGRKLIETETAETGSVSKAVYWHYIRCLGLLGAVTAIGGQTLYSCSNVLVSQWLTWWTDSKFGNSSQPDNRNMYLGVYAGLGLAQTIIMMSYTAVLAITTLNASKLLHSKMLIRVMQSPMSFFDTTPLGRIVNRFAKDVDVCDQTLPQTLRSWLIQFTNFLATIVIIMTVIPWIIVFIIPISIVFFFIQSFYVSTSRQLRRLESVSRSPIYSHFGETITGAATIRAFGRERDFMRMSEEKVDSNQVAYYPSIMTNRWLAIFLEFLGNLVTLGTAMFIILRPGSFNSSQVGLVITYSLNITQSLNWLVRITADIENNIVGVERIKEYSELEQEAAWVVPTDRVKRDWPDRGRVEFNNYGLRYRAGLELVIRDINVRVSGGEKVGIVGRTGAGKSTLTVALFRLVEAAQGNIRIDGKKISDLGLHDLRSKLTIIPQDPVLFSGSLRMNLDPFSSHSDQQVWAALEQAHLKQFVTELEAGLDHEVQEGGENLSLGQKQLVCLARALLRKTRVLILDEATAAVDLETDDLIQETIRREFAESTVLTIAHRLNTIMDYDRIMVLDKGELREFDSPDKLLEDPDSIFHGMAEDAGLLNNSSQTATRI